MKTLNSCISGNFRVFTLAFLLACLAALAGCTKESSVSSGEITAPIPATVERFDKKLSDPQENPYHATANKLFKRWQETRKGLDSDRYHTTYAYVITVDEFSFAWETYLVSHPSDVVLYHDVAERTYKIFTNEIDRSIFITNQPAMIMK